nr:RagB/SusD family nutrient uptake outer membrane protein [Bacteroidota bacterium]
MKNIYRKITLLGMAVATMLVTSCSFDEQTDPNGPSVDGVQSEATIGQLNELVIGVEASFRNGLAI